MHVLDNVKLFIKISKNYLLEYYKKIDIFKHL